MNSTRTIIEKERAIYLEQAQASGKPQEIIEKMVEGRLRKEYFQQVVLMQQTYVVDGKATVEQAVKAFEKEIGSPVKSRNSSGMHSEKVLKRKKTTLPPKSLLRRAQLNFACAINNVCRNEPVDVVSRLFHMCNWLRVTHTGPNQTLVDKGSP